MKRTKRISQFATTRVICNHFPISQKAYDGFRERIRKVHEYLGYDAGDMLTMLDEYLAGDKDAGGGCCLADKMAFMLMRDEIDRAMTRSARARENARLRRARKEQERQECERQEAPDGHEELKKTVLPINTRLSASETQNSPESADGLRATEKSLNADSQEYHTRIRPIGANQNIEHSDHSISSVRDRRCVSDTWCADAG